MPQPSKIDRLPGEIREAIGTLRSAGHTLDEIMAELQQMGIEEDALPSRSGLHRHIQGLDALAERLQKSRAIAEALVRRLGDAPENRTARLNIELMHSVVTDLMLAVGSNGEDGQPVTLDPENVHFLAKSLDHLARAQRVDADLTLKIRTETERQVKAAANKAVDSVAKEKGLSAETVAAIKAQILGVKAAA